MLRGVAYALASAGLFGVSTPLAKTLLGTVSPLVLAGLLYAGSGVGLMLVLAGRALRSPRALAAAAPKREEWRWLAGAVFFGGVVAPVALMYGLATTAASTASLLLNLEAVFTVLLAWFLFRENFDRRVAFGMLAIVAGGVALGWSPGGPARVSAGLPLIALACLCWALDNNLTRKVSAADAVTIAGIKGVVAGSVNLGLALALGHPLPPVGSGTAAALLGFAGYGVSLVLFVLALRHLGSARTSAYFSIAPFFGAAVAVLVQGETVTWQLVAAGILMATGVWLHVTERHQHLHAHEAQEHTHAHIHDEHHRHEHAFEWDGREPHTHAHVHAPLVHAHAHYPDVHHRHPH
jgi:drug/metabolite transporter (DMT)-like permease